MKCTRIRVDISTALEINLDAKSQGVKDSSIGLEIELIKDSESMSVIRD